MARAPSVQRQPPPFKAGGRVDCRGLPKAAHQPTYNARSTHPPTVRSVPQQPWGRRRPNRCQRERPSVPQDIRSLTNQNRYGAEHRALRGRICAAAQSTAHPKCFSRFADQGRYLGVWLLPFGLTAQVAQLKGIGRAHAFAGLATPAEGDRSARPAKRQPRLRQQT